MWRGRAERQTARQQWGVAYTLEAILLDAAAARAPHGLPAVALPHGLTLIPVTGDVFDRLAADHPSAAREDHPPFWKFNAALEAVVLVALRFGRVAYVEADFFGGVGTQTAATWQDGAVVMAPEQRNGPGPINEALHFLGVVPDSGQDEFAAVNLSRFRHTDDWIDS